jgi:putative transposase
MDGIHRIKKAGARSLRHGRRSIPGQYYHVITCTAERRGVFSDLYCGREVVRSLRRLEREHIARSLAFVVMPDHVHWLLQLQGIKRLPVCIGSMKSFAARNIIANALAQGPIWQKGYMDRAIRREKDLVRVARYIVANPLRAGIVEQIGMYPLWDSMWLNDPAPCCNCDRGPRPAPTEMFGISVGAVLEPRLIRGRKLSRAQARSYGFFRRSSGQTSQAKISAVIARLQTTIAPAGRSAPIDSASPARQPTMPTP